MSGWGRNDFAYGSNQAIQRKVDLPMVDRDTCQKTLRMTKLGNNFVLDPGFMCAGKILKMFVGNRLHLNSSFLLKEVKSAKTLAQVSSLKSKM